MINLLIADDHELFREGLKRLLRDEQDITLLSAASDGEEAIELAGKLNPDIILMDVTMPKLNGIQATERILKNHPHTLIIALSMHGDRRFIAEILKAGAKGYVLKESSPQILVDAIRTVARGDIFLSPRVCTIMIEDYLRLLQQEERISASPLSDREKEVLLLLARGHNTKQVAGLLSISKNTVDAHRRHILDKLNCSSLVDLTRYAIREGLLSPD